MVGQRLGQSTVTGESSAPVAVFLAIGNQGGIVFVAVQNGLEYGVAILEHLVLGNGFAVDHAGPRFLGQGLDARVVVVRDEQLRFTRFVVAFASTVGKHELADFFGRQTGGYLQVGRQAAGLGHGCPGVFNDPFAGCIVQYAYALQLGGVAFQRIDRLPGLDLLLHAVGGSVRGRVAREAVGDGFQQHGTIAVRNDFALAAYGVDHGQWIVAIHPFGVHGVRTDPGPHTSEGVEGHRFARSLAAHPIEIVHEVEYDGQTALEGIFPQFVELPHAGEVHRLPGRAAAHGGVPNIGYDEAVLAVHLLEEGGTRCDVRRPAHYGVVRVDAERRKECVHGTTQAAVEAGGPGKDFGKRSIEQEVASQGLHALGAFLFHRPQAVAS